MHILLLTQWFDPEPTFKGLPFAKKLKELGHSVEVLTGFPNYPGGKLYNGYRVKLIKRENMVGIPVSRVPLYPSHNHSSIKRIGNYGSFSVSATLIGKFVVKTPDVIYVYHPPATIGLPAFVLSRMYKAPFVYDIQDLWPDTLGATGMMNNSIALTMLDGWCRWIYKQAARIVVLSPGFKKALINRRIPGHKIEVIYNWCEESFLKPENPNADLAKRLGFSGRFNILFAGNMGEAQALDAVLDAAAILENQYPQIQFVLIGGGIAVRALKRKVNESQIGNVRFLNRRPFSEIGAVLNMADVLLVHLRKDPLFDITIPSKTQAYMSVGKPILMGVQGDASDIVTTACAGITCRPEDPLDIASAVEQLYQMPTAKLGEMGQNGRRFYEKEMALDVGVRKFVDIFQALTKKKG
ncbi:MAG: glycosyltransferase family 4 protein [Desulfobacterales bacterium]